MTDVTGRLRASLEGRYRLEREIGAGGGMATVYVAYDVRHDRRVALKVLRPELSAILGAERFLVEIKTTANLQHPHILSLFDSGEVDGLVFYVMPLVEGESLRDRLLREKQLPVDQAVRIAREVASALDYAHRHGAVHRSEGGTRMTETGMSLGTPQYMVPEQAMGEREITPKADCTASWSSAAASGSTTNGRLLIIGAARPRPVSRATAGHAPDRRCAGSGGARVRYAGPRKAGYGAPADYPRGPRQAGYALRGTSDRNQRQRKP